MPNYIASGSHKIDGERLRFLILPRYDQDIEKILNKNNNKFNLKTVIVICTQLLDILEYIHSKGYVHCDIKASNILYSLQNNFNQTQMEIKPEMNIRNIHRRQCNPHRQCRKNQYTSVICSPHNLRKITTINYNESFDEIIEIYDQPPEIPKVENKNGKIHLLDYGLATKYRLSDGQHRQYCNDERKAHAGTILFCSLDAHLGAQSRRSDLESLGYNMIYWLTSRLPWEEHIENPEIVQKEKQKHFQDLDKFLKTCFDNDYPQFVYNYFEYVKYLTFESKPDYKHFKNLLTEALGMYGYKKDDCLDFDNLEGWGKKPKLKKKVCNLNLAVPSGRTPLASNTVIKRPMLRGKKRKQKKINWSEILSKNPEELLRQHNKNEVVNKPRDRKITDPSENTLQNLDIWKLNPTYAMIEVYNKLKDRNGNYNGASMKNSKSIGDCIEHVDGNTHAMNLVLSRMNERKLKENCEEQILSTRRRLVRNNSKKTSIEVKRSRSSPSKFFFLHNTNFNKSEWYFKLLNMCILLNIIKFLLIVNNWITYLYRTESEYHLVFLYVRYF